VQHLFARLDPRGSECFTCPNLFGLHPPMQIDGNFGITAGICEMLLQSQDSELDLLPALPPEWPDGSVTGLRARGGFAVDENWRGGRLVSATIHSTVGGTAIVRYGGQTREIEIRRNGSGRYIP
jgi:alpha-L-fucosidase 2